MSQSELFDIQRDTKTYRAIRHDVVREKQKANASQVHHPKQKKTQITRILDEAERELRTLELFAGEGNLTKTYLQYGQVECYDKKHGTGDSYRVFHSMIGEKRLFDVIDLDPYGFPNRFFPDIYMLIEDGYLFITMPKPSVNILNGITQAHLISYYNEPNPSLETIVEQLAEWGICHWRQVEVISVMDLKSIWRIALRVKKVKATEYTGVNNR